MLHFPNGNPRLGESIGNSNLVMLASTNKTAGRFLSDIVGQFFPKMGRQLFYLGCRGLCRSIHRSCWFQPFPLLHCTALRLACHGVKFESFGNGTKRIQARPFQWPLGDVCELGGAVDTAEKLGNGQSDRCLISCPYSGLCTILRLESMGISGS